MCLLEEKSEPFNEGPQNQKYHTSISHKSDNHQQYFAKHALLNFPSPTVTEMGIIYLFGYFLISRGSYLNIEDFYTMKNNKGCSFY